jgi:hypothetical protein
LPFGTDEETDGMNSSHQKIASADPQSTLTHPQDVTHWRCRRLGDGRGRGIPLGWIGAREWPIETLSPDAITDRWGPGTYVVEFVRVNGEGAWQKRGRSGPMTFAGPPIPTAETFADPIAQAVYTVRRIEYERAALARRSLEREDLQRRADLERYRLTLAHTRDVERIASNVAIARIQANAPARPVEIRFSDLIAPALAKTPGPTSKPN